MPRSNAGIRTGNNGDFKLSQRPSDITEILTRISQGHVRDAQTKDRSMRTYCSKDAHFLKPVNYHKRIRTYTFVLRIGDSRNEIHVAMGVTSRCNIVGS